MSVLLGMSALGSIKIYMIEWRPSQSMPFSFFLCMTNTSQHSLTKYVVVIKEYQRIHYHYYVTPRTTLMVVTPHIVW
jgi:hypothetical protein